jgi:hypothetical protein
MAALTESAGNVCRKSRYQSPALSDNIQSNIREGLDEKVFGCNGTCCRIGRFCPVVRAAIKILSFGGSHRRNEAG